MKLFKAYSRGIRYSIPTCLISFIEIPYSVSHNLNGEFSNRELLLIFLYIYTHRYTHIYIYRYR